MGRGAIHERGESERTPVNVYRAEDRVLITALTPGLQPDDILVEVRADGRPSLHGLRGLLLGDEVVELAPGSYQHEIELPGPVDGERADLTYRSGVLLLALRGAAVGATGRGEDTLGEVGALRGQGRPRRADRHRAIRAARTRRMNG